MYVYDDFDEKFVRERAAQFRDQVERRLSGQLSEAQFRPLRLMNGVYLQLHAYMLRVAVPYGTLSSEQLRQLAMIGRLRLRRQNRAFASSGYSRCSRRAFGAESGPLFDPAYRW